MFNKKWNKVWTILGIVILILVIYFLSKHTHVITDLLIKSGPLAPVVATLLYPLLAPTPITTDPITVIIGVAYGPLTGVIIAWIGNTLAAIVEYYLGSKMIKADTLKKGMEKMPFGLARLPINSIGFLIFGRMIPGYGGKIISILAGAYKVPMKRYVWTTAVVVFFGSVLLAYGGFGIVSAIKFTNIFKILGI